MTKKFPSHWRTGYELTVSIIGKPGTEGSFFHFKTPNGEDIALSYASVKELVGFVMDKPAHANIGYT